MLLLIYRTGSVDVVLRSPLSMIGQLGNDSPSHEYHERVYKRVHPWSEVS
jgi:hypothetical protein